MHPVTWREFLRSISVTEYCTVYRMPGFLYSRPNWVPPSPTRSVAPPPFGSKVGRHTLLGGRSGGTQFRRRDRQSGTLCTLYNILFKYLKTTHFHAKKCRINCVDPRKYVHQWWAKWRISTFDLYPGGEGHGVQGQICDILRPQLASFLPLWPHRFPHFGCINLGGALILDRCRAFDLFASVDAHLWCPCIRVGNW